MEGFCVFVKPTSGKCPGMRLLWKRRHAQNVWSRKTGEHSTLTGDEKKPPDNVIPGLSLEENSAEEVDGRLHISLCRCWEKYYTISQGLSSAGKWEITLENKCWWQRCCSEDTLWKPKGPGLGRRRDSGNIMWSILGISWGRALESSSPEEAEIQSHSRVILGWDV